MRHLVDQLGPPLSWSGYAATDRIVRSGLLLIDSRISVIATAL